MEEFGLFIGQLVAAAIYTVIACLVGHIAPVFGILFCVSIFFIAISANLMEDHNGVGRIVIFCIGLAFLIIPSLVQSISVIKSHTGTIMGISHFAVCAGLALTEWLMCGNCDNYWYMLDVLIIAGIILVALILKAITKSIFISAIILLIAGIIALIVMLIIRIVSGSALSD